MEFESIIVAVITGLFTLVGVIIANAKSRAVMEIKIEQLTAEVAKHNKVIERTYRLEQDVAVLQTEIKDMKDRG